MPDIMTIITLAVALLPTVVIMAIVISNARFKREPAKKIASVFAISALSTIPAAVIEAVGQVILFIIFGIRASVSDSLEDIDNSTAALYHLLEFMLIVGPAEEACKFFTFKWMIFHDRDFDNTYDGVIYGAASALGFATLENLIYVFAYNDEPLGTAALRAVLSVPMHAITGIVMGYWFGISKYRKYNNIKADTKPEIPAFIFSVVLHGTYDFLATLPEIYEDSDLVLWVSWILLCAVMIFIYVTMWRTIRKAKNETYNIYNRYYYEYLNGHFQDMLGGKTSAHNRLFLGMPLPMFYGTRQNGFDPYRPYAGMNAPPPGSYGGNMYTYGTQQPYNPYYGSQYPQTPYTPYPLPEQPAEYPLTVPENDTKVCPVCANIQRADSNFCAKCGNSLEF